MNQDSKRLRSSRPICIGYEIFGHASVRMRGVGPATSEGRVRTAKTSHFYNTSWQASALAGWVSSGECPLGEQHQRSAEKPMRELVTWTQTVTLAEVF